MHIRRHPAALAASLLAVGALGTGVAIAATNPGDPDPDFNGGQTRLVDFPDMSSSYDVATQVAVAPDGTIYVAGCTGWWTCNDEGDTGVGLSHLSAGGDPDPAFGGGAIYDPVHRLLGGPTALGFAPNGDVLVGGSDYAREVARDKANDDGIDGDFTVYRYNSAGTFQDQARDDFANGSPSNSFVRGFMPLSEGRQLVMGSAGDGNLNNNRFATMTLAAGTDTVTGDSEDDRTQAQALTAGHQAGSATGSYVIAGAGQTYTPPTTDLLVAQEPSGPVAAWVLHRYNADGSRDDSYGGEFPGGDLVEYIDGIDGSLAGDGATYLLADVNIDGDYQQQVVRFTADGQPDTAFGTQTAQSTFGDSSAYDLKAVAGTPDGKVVVAAEHRTELGGETVVARLNADGTLDPAFGDGGIRVLPNTDGADEMDPADVTVQSDGKAVVAGSAAHYGEELALTRSKRALAADEQQAFVTRLGTTDKTPPVTTTGTTATTTTTTTTTQTTTTTTPTAKPVTAQSVTTRVCSSKRAFKIRLRIPRGDHPKSATVKVNGKTVKVVKGSRLRSTIDLRGLPKGTVKVSITVTLAGGKKPLKGQRTYHTCIPKQGDSIPVL